MNYLIARNAFLAYMPGLDHDERLEAIRAFDQTWVAHVARLQDAWAAFWDSMPWR